MVETKSNFVVLDVLKNKTGKQINWDDTCLIDKANGFKIGERMLLNTNAGNILAVKGKKGWSIDKQTCRRYTENLSKLIS